MKRVSFIWGINPETYGYEIIGELLADGTIVLYEEV